MKFTYYLIISLLVFTACDESDELVTANQTLIAGKWKNTESFISSGGPQYWVDVENGMEIEFFENGIFSSNRFTECTDGNFSLLENELLLEYSCNDFDSGAENENGFITYNLEFYSSYFIITPTSGPICIEGCSYKFKRQ